MSEPIIVAEDLRKEFRIARRQPGTLGALRSLFVREYETRVAVDRVSFQVQRGELVGYIGPNGAGKSTTIKILTGILVPTGGRARVRGLVPYEQRVRNARQIGVVFGQRTQLWWDLPAIESFELLRHVYGVSEALYRQNMAMFGDILGLGDFLHVPVRQLSLGQRMRADLAAALLHNPEVVYLDEPTIGLDVVAKDRMRNFIRQINQERGVTIILTTHDMQDVEKLCSRMILIDHGRVVYDGPVADIKRQFGRYRMLVVDLDNASVEVAVDGAETVRRQNGRVWLRFDRTQVSAADLISRVAGQYGVVDLTIEEPEIEGIVARVYQEGIIQASDAP